MSTDTARPSFRYARAMDPVRPSSVHPSSLPPPKQVIEGPKEAVLKLYDIISADDRHVGLNLLEQGPIESRVYPEFGMALANASSGTSLPDLASISDSAEYAQHLVRLQYSSRLIAANADEARRILAGIVEISVPPAG